MEKETSPSAQNKLLHKRLEEVICRLDLDNCDSLIRSWEQFKSSTNRHIVRQAFETIGTHSVFGFNTLETDQPQKFTPILYLCVANDDAAAKEIHRLVWSQGVVPLLFIVTPDALQIRRSLAPPPEKPTEVSWARLSNEQELPVELTSMTAIALRSSIVWRDLTIDRSSRVDKILLDGIISLSHTVQIQNPNLDRAIIHALIGRFIYFYVLLDRNVIDSNWLMSLKTPDGRELCPSIEKSLRNPNNSHSVWPATEVWELFDQIDEVMNGAIFPVQKIDREKVDDQILHLIHRVIRHGDRLSLDGRQLSFLDVSFSTLRTETISAIYEIFLALESDGSKSDDGAFYTPPFLVDYVLDEVDRIDPITKSSRVLDPAAGSGIFLVGAYRRMLERNLPTGPWTARHFRSSRKLLEQNIFGVERNLQAANVCRFSLYLTLLDYINNKNINALVKMAQGNRVFPPLTDNIISRDLFELTGDKLETIGRFSHVVGNPPWGSFGDSASRTNEQRTQNRQEKIALSMEAAVQYHESLDAKTYPVSNKRLSELFIWKIKRDLLADNGTLGILISTKSFVSRIALAFPNAIARQFAIVGIANLSHFRYRLFAAARSPTIAVFARNIEPHPLDKVWIYAPLLSSQPIGNKGHLWSIIVNAADVETHRLRDLVRSPESWFDHLILRPLDRRYARHFRAWTKRSSQSLGDFISAAGLKFSRGGSSTQTGLPKRLLLKADTLQTLGLDGFAISSYPHNDLMQYEITSNFKTLFAGNILLISRSMNNIHFIESPIGFSSTFNAVYFATGPVQAKEKKLLSAMACYLVSDVARYFYALTGKSWILDHARLEKLDLEAVPFPISGINDRALDVFLSNDQEKITALISDRMKLDNSFADAVWEYVNFRSGFEDSQLPSTSLQRPDSAELDRYQKVLSTQLDQVFGSQAKATVKIADNQNDDYFARLHIHFAQPNEPVKPDTSGQVALPDQLSQFSPYSAISYDPETGSLAIAKPWTHVAWTMEQAFADARSISNAVLRSEASI